MTSILQLFKMLGALAAIVLSVGIFAKNKATTNTTDSPLAMASMAAPTASESEVPLDALGRRPEAPVERSKRQLEMPRRPERQRNTQRDTRSQTSTTVNYHSINEWINNNGPAALLEAEQATIAPGAILATGIYLMQQGQADNSMTAADVADYLMAIRDNASAEAKSRMKYIANSEQWFTGLDKAGYDGAALNQLFDEYHLGNFDKEMYNRHVTRKVERTDYDTPDTELAEDNNRRNQDLAEAYNDYADRDEVRRKHNLQTFTEAAPTNRREVSKGRREAENLAVGESKTYDDPRFFWAVLQETIALEKGYASWEEYKSDDSLNALREFERRSDIMASGGVMKVTRQR